LSEQDLDDVAQRPAVCVEQRRPAEVQRHLCRTPAGDELSCYIFDVAPKTIEKKQRIFKPRVVDDNDLQIVMSDGKAVPDIINKNK